MNDHSENRQMTLVSRLTLTKVPCHQEVSV